MCFGSVLKFGDLSVYRVSVLWKLSSLGLSDLVGDRRCRAGVLQVRRFNLMPQMTVGMNLCICRCIYMYEYEGIDTRTHVQTCYMHTYIPTYVHIHVLLTLRSLLESSYINTYIYAYIRRVGTSSS